MAKKMYNGDSKTFRLKVYEKLANGQPDLTAPVPLTGSLVEFSLKADDDISGTVLVYKSSANGATEVEILSSPDDNTALIKLVSEDTQDLDEGDYLFDMQVTFVSTQQVKTVAKDLLCISSGVTN